MPLLSFPGTDTVSGSDAVVPLTPNQERLWFLHRLEPDSVSYNLPWVLDIRGRLDLEALERSLGEIVRRHMPLRCRFVETDGGVAMAPLRDFRFELPVTELDAAGSDPEAVLAEALRAEAAIPFDLSQGPPARFRLLRVDDERHALTWSVHHIVYDLSSYNVMLDELEALYPLYLDGAEPEASPLEPLAMTFGEYTTQVRQRAEDGEQDAAFDHWQRALTGFEPLELPLDRPRPQRPTRSASTAVRRLDAGPTAALRELARSHGRSTVFSPALAAFYVLLRGLSGQDDLVLGVPIAGRDDAETRRLVGFFVDVLALRVDLSDDPTFDQLVDHAQALFLDARRFPQPPVDRLAGALAQNRRAGENPFFPATFQLAREPRAPELPGLVIEQRRLRAEKVKFDIRMDVYDRRDHLSLEIEFDTEIFEPATIDRWLDAYVQVLEQAVAAPDRPVSELILTTPGDRATLRLANATAADFPGDTAMIDQVRRHVAATPESIAVVDGERRWTWAELGRRADHLASRLAAAGVRPGDVVGLCVERGAELPLGMLGILAAGGAYVCLDPDYPDDRLRTMIDDSGLTTLVIHGATADRLPRVDGVGMLDLDELEGADGGEDEPPRWPIDGSFPACLIYTSGSTGVPKASVLTQRGVTRLVVGTTYTTFGADDVFSQTASPSFDAATFEIWGALLNGGTLVIVDRDVLLSPEALGDLVRDEGVTVLFLTTAYFQMVARRAAEVFTLPRAVFFGGERCEPDAVRRAVEACRRGGTRLFHAYGPSECTTYATLGEVVEVPPNAASVPIGGPVTNTTAHVVDPLGREVPIGVAGELWLGGPGLADAYHDRPRLSAASLVPDPFGDQPGARLYRTGDRVRWLADGRLDFLGRVDHQVKLRGFRIELGEIEAALQAHPEVDDAVVMVREDVVGDRRLVAYASRHDTGGPEADGVADRMDGAGLRSHLADVLPTFMVPSAVIVLGTLPLNANGKVDRRLLPAPERGEAAVYRAPETAHQRLLAELWCDALGLETVGLDDDLFVLGGHSLIVVRLVSQLRDRLGVEVPVRRLFESSRLEAAAAMLGEEVEAAAGGSTTGAAVDSDAAIERARAAGALSFAQEGLWFLWRLDPESSAYDMPFVLRLRGDLDRSALERAWTALYERHEILRTRYPDVAGAPRAVVDPPPTVGLEPRVVESEAALEAALDACVRQPFDLEAGPVSRLHLFRVGEAAQDHALLFEVHHIAFDGWSYGVLRAELAALYEHFAHDAEMDLDPAPSTFADHAARQRARFDERRLEASIEPWRRRLDGLEPLDLPTDHLRSDGLSPAARRRRPLPAATARALRELTRDFETTFFVTALAAFDVLLQALTSRDDPTVGVPEAGRDQAGTERAIGYFINNLVLRVDLSGDPTFEQVVARVRDTFLDARGQADVPYDRLVEALAPERRSGRNPFFDVSFQAMAEPRRAAFGGLEVADRVVPPTTAKFDLAVSLLETADGGVDVDLEWAADLFESTTIERWIDLFCRLVEQVAADPGRRLSTLDILAAGDAEIIASAHRHDPSYDPSASLPALFAEVAARRGDHPAARYADGDASYRTIDRRGRWLAAALAEHGVSPADHVGVCMPRSVDWPAAIVGIGYAGAAYVPLDPDYPLERLELMASDAATRVIVGHGEVARRLAESVGSALVETGEAGWEALGERWGDATGELGDPPPVAVTGELPAYVIYTSGSTGRPKGVVVPHRGVVAAVLDPLYGKTEDDVMSQGTSLSFDVAHWELWSTLLTGATLVGLGRDDLLDVRRLGSRLADEGVTCLELPGPVFDEVARQDPSIAARCRWVSRGGERCDPTTARLMIAAGARPINAYGPTEASINVTNYLLTELPDDANSVPIGQGGREVVLRVLDALGRPVPIGVAGELCLGGPLLADGYLGRPARTAVSFVPDPFAGLADGPSATPAGARLYRTGDRVRWLPTGDLDFLGRIDDQVKIRGFRVEPGEVEAILGRHPETGDVAVVARPDATGGLRLLAWAAPAAPLADEAARRALGGRLHEHLAEQLPAHMVPAVVQVLEVMPLTPNDKIDRKALPDPDPSAFEHVAPRTATERALASIWSDVLRVEAPSVTTGFFELGGHSLLATRLVARIRERFGVDVPLRQLFEQPTIEGLATLLPEVPGAVDHDDDPERAAAIAEAREAGVLSFAQRRLWTVMQLDPESTAYNMPFALRLGGALDRRALVRALDAILERHDVLRGRYVVSRRDGGAAEPRMVVEPPTPVDLDAITREVESSADLDAALRAEASRPFDLEREVLRLRLFVGAEGSGMAPILLFHVHHIAFDGWSFGLLQHELATLHDAFAADPERAVETVLPRPAVQYADHAARQSLVLDVDRLAALIEPWRRRLAGLEPLELPVDRPRQPHPERTVTSLRRRLPQALEQGARRLARDHDRTLFTTLLTAFAVTLQAITGRDDFAVGAPEAGRRHTDVEELMGFFVDMLVLRLDVGDDPSLDTLMTRVHETVVEARDHSEVPFDALVEALSPDRQLGRNPFFEIAFQVVETAPPGSPPAEASAANGAGAGLELSELPVALGQAKLDLILDVEDGGDELELVTHFADELFDVATVERWLDRFERCLAVWIADPARRLSSLDLRSEADREMVEASNRRANPADPEDYPGAVSLFEQARRQVEIDADKAAVVHHDTVVTWGELIDRAERLGRHLIARGVRPGDFVGLGVDRGPRWVEGMLGIAAAGAAYVPLDIAYPPDRLRFMIEDSGMRVLIGETDSLDLLPEVDDVDVVNLDGSTAGDDATPLPRVDGDFPAYMIFTSGSSGRPKGTVVPQRAVTRLVVDTRHFDHRPDDVVAQVVSPSFDPSVWEMWSALLQGATVAVIDREALVSPSVLDAEFARHGVTVAVLSTAVFHQVARQSPRTLARLRVALFGGERCDPQAVRLAAEAIRGSETYLVNGYGPTECTVMATGQRVTEVADDAVSIPIGPPTTRNTVRVVDALGREVGIGVPGELWIGGRGVADGYHRRPSLTAAVFVPDEQSSEPGARCYRTGDLVRWLEDGSLDFLGRIDQQVKLRGYRIEPGEIETALARHPRVAGTAVIVREDQPNNPRLVAYATPEDGAERPEPEALRDFLADELPDFMVPSVVMVLDRLPLTANGKVDRRLLPAPELDESTHVAPRDATEEALAEIWRALLGVAEPSVTADFFALGGHSLLATSLVAEVRDQLGVEMPVRWVFEDPTIEALARRVAASASGAGDAAGFVPPALVRQPDDAPRALTFGQERLWFLDRLMQGSAVYNIPFVQRLRGPLDLQALDRTLVELVRRHDALRSRFPEDDGQPKLVVDPPPETLLTPEGVGDVPEAERRERLDAWLLDEASQPFDLEAGPVFRARLLRLADDDHVLALTVHHIVSDGASTELLARKVSQLYATFHDDPAAASPLGEPPIRLSDVAAWQREWLTGEPLAHLTDFWREELAGLQPTELPADRPRPALFDHAGGERRRTLDPELVDQGRELARALKVTPFQLYLAAFLVVLQRYTGQDDLTIGSLSAGRDRTALIDLVGFLVHTQVLRTRLDGDPTFGELVGRVRETSVRAQAHQEMPFEKLVEAIDPDRDPARHPFFQIAFQYLAYQAPTTLGGLDAEWLTADGTTTKFDLTLGVVEDHGRLRLEVEYATALFDAATVDRLMASYVAALRSAFADAGQRIGELNVVPADERLQLLVDWNRTAEPFPRRATLIDAVREQARRTPDADALVVRAGDTGRAEDGIEVLSYRELWRRVETLAGRLRGLGVGPEVPVVVCLDRRVELIVSLLAVLEAGGIYVPVDPTYPRERVGFTLEDTAARAVITREALVEILPDAVAAGQTETRLVVLDRPAELPPIDESPGPMPSPESLAYLIYTSGSTGRPKGVAIRQTSAVAMVAWAHGVFSPEETAGTLVATSVCFDLSVYEIFVPLSRGGTLILADNALALPELPAAARERVTLINTVPSALRELLRDGHLPATVRTVNLAGEALPRDLVDRAYEEAGVQDVYNLYGPSEDTTYSTFARVAAGTSPPIGRPIANTRAYVLDAELRPTPRGVPGELYLAGDGLARGYFGRPELTADRFVPDPFAGELGEVGATAGERMYRTGDLVVYRDDGVLHYLGRLDHQVKVRGFRVELGEVEAWLGKHPSVKERVVVARPDPTGSLRLVAYLVAADGVTGESSALRRHLSEHLPEHAVPTAWVWLDRLPLTPNGKVDRKALPDPELGAEPEQWTAPRTEIEAALAQIWADVLGVESPGVTTTFFELGGHSLLATRLVSRVRDRFGIEASVRWVFEQPTIEAMAAVVEPLAAAAESRLSSVAARETLATGADRPLSFGQRRLWFLARLEPESTAYNMPMPLRLHGDLDVEALRLAIGDLVARHESLRTRFVDDGGEPRAVIDPPLPIDLPVETAATVEAMRAVLADESSRPFDLAAGPVARWRLVRRADTSEPDHLLILHAHHIAYDGWSHGVVLRELVTAYEARCAGAEAELAPLPMTYAEHAAHQVAALTGDRLDTALDYWRRHLDGLEPLALPLDRPRPVWPTRRGGVARIRIPEALANRVREYGRQNGRTLFATLAAVYESLLHNLTGSQDLAIGVPDAGRPRSELEGIVGFFVDMLVVRTDLSADPSFDALAEQIQERLLDAREHADLPFEKLVEELAPVQYNDRAPFFQVTFQAVQDASIETFGDLRVGRFEAAIDHAKFDLSVGAFDLGGEIEIHVLYAAELFEASTIERWLDLYERLLGQAMDDPQRRLSALWALPAGDAERLPRAADLAEGVVDGSLVDAFARQAAVRGDQTAATYPDGSLTYRQLDRRARELAAALIARGIRPGDRVGSAFGRSIDLLVSMLGIGYAGAAYVPLDPTLPTSRLALMLEDTKTRLVVHRGEATHLPTAGTRIDLEALGTGTAGDSVAADGPLVEVGGEAPAYVIFTSGSTGRPKGVEVAHHAVLNMLSDPRNAFGSDDVMAQLANPAFDVSGREIWLALTRGGRLHGVDRDDLLDPRRLARRFDDGGVTHCHLPAAVFHEIAAQDPAFLGRLKQVVVGGDRVDPTAVRRALAVGVTMVQSYGPTETAIDATFHEIQTVAEEAGAVPIGRGVPRVELHVLDRHGRPVPIGVEGELVIGGPALAYGYVAQPALTAAAFVPDPFTDEPGRRLYRTGDRVRWLPAGVLEFVGRIDRQVKIRGHRIEPGEVEAALAEHPAVRHAAVDTRADAAGSAQLIAWAEVADAEVEPGDLLADLGRRLPAAFVPASIVVVAEMPRTASGKIDRAALPDPELDAAADYEAPRNAVEEALARIWAEVLDIESPSVSSSFFELGGHSLLATRLVAKIRESMAIDVPVRAVFEQPTIAEMTRRLATYPRVAVADDPDLTAAIDAARQRGVLSFGQRRMWFLARLEPESVAYNLPFPMRFQGVLDVEILARALTAIIDRHEVLRTRFVADDDGEPRIVVDPTTPVELSVEDFSATAEPVAAVAAAVDREIGQPFDLAVGPIVRWRLFRIATDDHLLLGHAHHIAFDGVSNSVFLAELSALYEAFLAGEPAPLAPLPMQYSDHAARQSVLLESQRSAPAVEHWRQRLAGLEPLELPTDRPRPTWPTNVGGTVVRQLPAPLAAASRELGRRHGYTLFTVLLSAYDVLLHGLTGGTDLAVGVPESGRPTSQLEDLVGFFVDMLVLRTDLRGDPSFLELADRVQTTLLDAREHANVPFERLVEALQPERNTGASPFFQTAFQVQFTGGSEQFGGLEVGSWPLESSTTKFDLYCAVADDGDSLSVGIEYAAELFEQATIDRWLDGFEQILAAAVADPTRRLSQLSPTTESDRHLVARVNDVAADFPAEASLMDQVREVAARRPDADVVRHRDTTVSWSDLLTRAERIGRDLVATGVRPGDRVGLCAERGRHWVDGMLGILAAGAAYVPLDADYPEDRLSLMVEDTEMAALVATASQADLPGIGSTPVLTLPRPDGPAPDVELPQVDGDFPAYVIFTSGSTGRPKGVVVSQRAVTRLVINSNYMELAADPVVAQVSSPSFDACSFEVWTALLGAGTLAVIDRQTMLEPTALAAAFDRHGVTDFLLTTAYFQELVRQAPHAFEGRRSALFGGERCDPEAIREAVAVCRRTGTRLVHAYGPTECTVIATAGVVESVPEGAASVPIGGPIANTTIYVVDSWGRQVPLGVAGELWLGGPGVAEGYLHRPATTAGVFVPDPFSGLAGARCYRTGDLVRLLPDGQLDILGRIDKQVKLRGFRIEPGEIEAVLARHPAVAAPFVMVREDRPGDRRLVAYATLVAEALADPPTGETLRAYLADELPDFMVPAVVMVLGSLPINPNGKVDQQALPMPEMERGDEHRPPETTVERFVATVLQEVLGVEEIGLDDDFFALGGHSLLAVKVFSRIHNMTEVELPLTLIFDHPTLGALAAAVERELAAQPEGDLILELLDELDALSDDEVEAALDEEDDLET